MSISFRPNFSVSGSFYTSSQYLFDFDELLSDQDAVFEYLAKLFDKGHVHLLNVNYYPAGKLIVDMCDCRDIDVRESVRPVGFTMDRPVFLDDAYNSFIRLLDVEIDHPN